MTGLEQQLADLMTMPPAQLRSLWRDTYRSQAPDIGPDLLRRGIANRLQERMHGSLTGSTKREIGRLRKRVERTGKAGHMHGHCHVNLAGDLRAIPINRWDAENIIRPPSLST